MQTCPICGKTVLEQQHWVRCPKEEKPVCMKHCFNDCNYQQDTCCGYKDFKQCKQDLEKGSKKNALHISSYE